MNATLHASLLSLPGPRRSPPLAPHNHLPLPHSIPFTNPSPRNKTDALTLHGRLLELSSLELRGLGEGDYPRWDGLA